MLNDNNKTARLEARVSPPVYNLLRQAAELQGRTLSDFVISSAREAAEVALSSHARLSLAAEEQRAFIERLLKPRAVKPALRRAAERHGRIIELA